jgi:hypothetical protein
MLTAQTAEEPMNLSIRQRSNEKIINRIGKERKRDRF